MATSRKTTAANTAAEKTPIKNAPAKKTAARKPARREDPCAELQRAIDAAEAAYVREHGQPPATKNASLQDYPSTMAAYIQARAAGMSPVEAMHHAAPVVGRGAAALRLARELEDRGDVQQQIDQLRAAAFRTPAGQDLVGLAVRQLHNILSSNVGDVAQVEVGPCEQCWSGGEHDKDTMPRTPDPECRACLGTGKALVKYTPTAALTPQQAAAIASIKPGRYGVEIVLASKLDAAARVGQLMGLSQGGETASFNPEELDAIMAAAEAKMLADQAIVLERMKRIEQGIPPPGFSAPN